MTDPAHLRVFVARRNVDDLLAGNPTRGVLKCRASAVQRLAEDCARFFPWPALHDSLMADVKRLREAAVAEARAVPEGWAIKRQPDSRLAVRSPEGAVYLENNHD